MHYANLLLKNKNYLGKMWSTRYKVQNKRKGQVTVLALKSISNSSSSNSQSRADNNNNRAFYH